MTNKTEFNLSKKSLDGYSCPAGIVYHQEDVKEFIRILRNIPFEILDAEEIREIITNLAGEKKLRKMTKCKKCKKFERLYFRSPVYNGKQEYIVVCVRCGYEKM